MAAARIVRLLCVLIAVGAIGSIAFAYSRYLTRDEWPPGHPWSALTLLYASIMNVIIPAKTRFQLALKLVVCVLTLLMVAYAVRIGLR
jgi:hypothetical protein